VSLLDDQRIEQGLAGGDWRREGQSIVRDYRLADFPAALAFVNRVGELAELANHHPDIHLHGWNRVRLELSTHSQGGLTEADLDLARRIDELS
jgi:4a-hydroxytetrahydrobiopterin dehydratase